jgi:PleD family two-component response regulator
VRVVVVDPSRTVLKAVSRLLESAGHGVAAFVDAREAFDYIKSDREVSALLASAQLNSMSGLELCWETRLLSGRERPIYIILMSSNSDQQHLINALDSGADEFIRKPPVGEELYARLRSAERLLRLQNELIELASIDPLTHVFNRRAFFDRRSYCAAGHHRSPRSCSMSIISSASTILTGMMSAIRFSAPSAANFRVKTRSSAALAARNSRS